MILIRIAFRSGLASLIRPERKLENESNRDACIKYIAKQKAHHREISFQDQYREFLRKYKIKYDERYVWD